MMSEKAVQEMYDMAVQRAARWEICAHDFEMREKAGYYQDQYSEELSKLFLLGTILGNKNFSQDIRDEKRRLELSGEAEEVLDFERRGGVVAHFKRIGREEED